MRAVNLLPEEQRGRRRRPTGDAAGNRSYAVLGVLAALLAMVTLYVLTANQVTAREAEAARVSSEADATEARVRALSPFGDFAQVARTRTASVKQLATGRFDWERLLRELALVLPEDTWLVEADASTKPDDEEGAAAGAVKGPAAKLTGCAKRQGSVAKLMLRLKRMHRAEDVLLQESASEASAGGSGSAGGCGKAYKFVLTVAFTATPPPSQAPDGSKRVPVSLGGGQ